MMFRHHVEERLVESASCFRSHRHVRFHLFVAVSFATSFGEVFVTNPPTISYLIDFLLLWVMILSPSSEARAV